MAITGVRTELDISIEAVPGGISTGLSWYMDNGTAKGMSNELAPSSSTAYLGKALNFIGNKAAAREIKVASNQAV